MISCHGNTNVPAPKAITRISVEPGVQVTLDDIRAVLHYVAFGKGGFDDLFAVTARIAEAYAAAEPSAAADAEAAAS
jgi:hypothetical protein